MKNYVISLTTALDRRTHITQEFGKQTVPFTFFDAITPTQVDALAQKFNVNIADANLTQGELACLFSHICLWQKAIDDNLDYIAIFEDDIYLGENSQSFLTQSDWIPKQSTIIKLEMFDQYVTMNRTAITHYQNRVLRSLQNIHLGAAGYILSQQMCQFLMQFIQHYPQGIVASDHILFEDYLKENQPIYQLVPALCVQSDRIDHQTKVTFTSSLEKDRRVRFNNIVSEKKQKRSISQKIHREISRLFSQFKNIFKRAYLVLFCHIEFK